MSHFKITGNQHTKKHRCSGIPEYHVWQGMRTRCLNQNSKRFRLYGARGIKICQCWLESFEAFFKDMGRRPSPKHQLDRFPDNNGNYEPGNCRWATRIEQARNKRTNHLLTFEGETKCLVEWAEQFGIAATRLHQRLSRGWTVERALKTRVAVLPTRASLPERAATPD